MHVEAESSCNEMDEELELIPKEELKLLSKEELAIRLVFLRKYNKATEAITRYRPYSISLEEMHILSFIYCRTYLFGKHTEGVSLRHFEDGIFRKEDGMMIQAPSAVSRRTVIRTLKKLVSKKLVFQQKADNSEAFIATNYTPNYHALITKAEALGMGKLKMSKKAKDLGNQGHTEEKRGGAQLHQGGVPNSTTEVTRITSNYIKSNTGEHRPTDDVPREFLEEQIEEIVGQVQLSPLPQKETLEQKVQSVTDSTRATRLAKQGKVAGGKASIVKLRYLWQESYTTHFKTIASDATGLTYHKLCLQMTKQGMDADDFIPWVMDSWEDFCSGSITPPKNMVLGPRLDRRPNVYQLVKNFYWFLRVYVANQAAYGPNVRSGMASDIASKEFRIQQLTHQLAKTTKEPPKDAVGNLLVGRYWE